MTILRAPDYLKKQYPNPVISNEENSQNNRRGAEFREKYFPDDAKENETQSDSLDRLVESFKLELINISITELITNLAALVKQNKIPVKLITEIMSKILENPNKTLGNKDLNCLRADLMKNSNLTNEQRVKLANQFNDVVRGK